MSADNTRLLTEQFAQLPPERQIEVIDFVQFLLQREQQERQLSHAASRLSESSLWAVWDNADDAAYDRL